MLRKIALRDFVPTTSLTLAIALFAAGSLTAPAIAADGENVVNGDFSNGIVPWFTAGDLTPTIVDGRLCVDVPGGTVNPWDAIVGQNGIALDQGVTYRYSYDVSSSVDGKNVRALVGLSVEPFTAYFTANELLTTTTTSSSNTFEQPATTPQGQVAFQLGGSPDPWTFCVDNVSLLGGSAPEPYVPDTGPRGPREPGRLPPRRTEGRDARHRRDRAVGVATEERRPERVVRSGAHHAGWNRRHVRAERPRDRLQPLQAPGEGSRSRPTARRATRSTSRLDGVRATAARRAVALLPAAQRHADPRRDRRGRVRARAAGHVGVPPNTGDVAVPCQPPEVSQTVYGEPWTCDYTLDVTGGWYDAGDHGKYVVNGGISVAQLMSTWERNQNARHTDRRRSPTARCRSPSAATASPTSSTRRAGSSSGC